MTHTDFIILVDGVHRQIPSGDFRVHFAVGDGSGEAFRQELVHFFEDSFLINGVSVESRHHLCHSAFRHSFRIENIED